MFHFIFSPFFLLFFSSSSSSFFFSSFLHPFFSLILITFNIVPFYIFPFLLALLLLLLLLLFLFFFFFAPVLQLNFDHFQYSSVCHFRFLPFPFCLFPVHSPFVFSSPYLLIFSIIFFVMIVLHDKQKLREHITLCKSLDSTQSECILMSLKSSSITVPNGVSKTCRAMSNHD